MTGWFSVLSARGISRFNETGERWSINEAIEVARAIAVFGRNLAAAGFGEQCKRDGHDAGYRDGFAKGEQIGRDDALTEVMHCL